MQPQFPYKLINGVTVYDRPDIRQCYLENVIWKRGYETHHKAKGPSKTLPQLAYYYGVVVEVAMNSMKNDAGNKDGIIIEVCGHRKKMPVIKDVVDWILKDAYAKSIGAEEVLKRNMSKMDCMALIDFAIMWCAKYLHVVIPEPDTNWRESK